MKSSLVLVAAAAAMAVAAPARAAEILLTGLASSGGASSGLAVGNSRAFSSGGFTGTATAYTYTTSVFNSGTQTPAVAYLGSYTEGLGVSRDAADNTSTGGQHAIDNYNGYDIIVLTFNTAVNLSKANIYGFDAYTGSSNPTTRVDYDTFFSFSTNGGANLWSDIDANGTNVMYPNYETTGGLKTVDTGFSNFAKVWVIGAAQARNGEDPLMYIDAFKLKSIIVTAQTPAVPEPATWSMMIGGFGVAGMALRRRRKTAVAQVIA